MCTSTITSGDCSPLLLYYYYFLCVEHDVLTSMIISLYYFYFPCVGHNDSTILRVVCTSMTTSGDYSPLLLLSMCQAWCLIYYFYFPCVGHQDSTVLGVVCTSMITSVALTSTTHTLWLFSHPGGMYTFCDPHPVVIAFLALPDGEWLIIGGVKDLYDHISWPLLSYVCQGISL